MNQDYPPYDDDEETRRRVNTPSVPPARPQPPQAPMARPVFPQSDATMPHRRADDPLPPEPETSGLYVPWWGFVLVILAVAGITCGLWAVVLMTRGETTTATGPTPTIVFVQITPTATLGAAPGPVVITSTPPAIPQTEQPAGGVSATPGGTGPTAPPSGGATQAPGAPIALGVTIQVSGTEGFGLTVRQGPGKDFTSVFVANEGDKFVVKDGPRQADSFTWWYIVDPGDQNRFGWAVQDFMRVVQ